VEDEDSDMHGSWHHRKLGSASSPRVEEENEVGIPP
jgi:hypothetical protein